MRLLHLNSRARPYAVRAATLIAMFGLLSSCKDSPTATSGQTITMAFASSTLTVSAAAPVTVGVSVTRGGGYSGTVALSMEQLPSGVTVSFDPAPLSGTNTASVATIVAGSTAIAGTYPITLRGSGTGVTSNTTTLQLTIGIASITLTAGAAVSAPQGGTATVPITITRVNGFAGAIALTAEGLPTGVTASFSPASIAAGTTSSTLTLSASQAAAAASNPITIRATGTGVADKTASVQLTVTSTAAPDYSLTAAPASLSVVAGSNSSSVITVAPIGGFNSTVSLALTGNPTGVTGTFTPNPAAVGTSNLAITTTAAALAGTYTLTVTGTAAGTTAHTTSITLVITALPGVTVSLAPATLSVAQSGTIQTAVTVARVGGFIGDVALTAENLPAGVTAAFAPTPLGGSATASTLTLTAASTAVAGTYTVTVRGTSGTTSGSATIALSVTGPAGYTTSLTPNTVSIAQGANGTITANVARLGGFAGTVNLAVTGLPSGIAATVAPAAVTGTSATITFAVGSAVGVGAYSGIVTSTATGLPTTTQPFNLTVTAGTGGGGNIQWQFCDPTRIPLFFAVRDGSTGAWTKVTPSSNTYSFSLVQATGGVAYVLQSGTTFSTTVFLQAKSEFAQQAASECASNPGGGKVINGTVTGLATTPTSQSASIALGGGSGTANGFTTAFTMNNVQDGLHDLLAARTTTNLSPFSFVVDNIIIRRGLNPAPNSTLPALNFGTEGFAPVVTTATVTNLGTDVLQTITQFTTANGSTVSTGFTQSAATSTRSVNGIPTAKLAAGDLHQLILSASEPGGTPTYSRTVLAYYADGTVGRTFALSSILAVPTISSTVSSSALRPRLQGTISADYPTSFGSSFQQAQLGKSVTVSATRAYFATNQFDLEVPDIAGLSGFNAASWSLTPGQQATYNLTALNASTVTAPTDGTIFSIGGRSGAVTQSAIRH